MDRHLLIDFFWGGEVADIAMLTTDEFNCVIESQTISSPYSFLLSMNSLPPCNYQIPLS